MAIFIGEGKDTTAVRAALKINYCAKAIVAPLLASQYPDRPYSVRHVVGIDVSSIHAARTGARAANDLVWVGRAANYAAKLTELPDYATWITADVYNRLDQSGRIGRNGGEMWERRLWTSMNDRPIYRSSWWWEI